MQKVLLVAVSIGFVVLVFVVSYVVNTDIRFDQDAGHAVIIRNDATLPVTVQLVGTDDVAVAFEVPPRSEAPVVPPASMATVAELTVFSGRCHEYSTIRFGSGRDHWSDLIAISGDGADAGYWRSEDATGWATRSPLPVAEARTAEPVTLEECP